MLIPPGDLFFQKFTGANFSTWEGQSSLQVVNRKAIRNRWSSSPAALPKDTPYLLYGAGAASGRCERSEPKGECSRSVWAYTGTVCDHSKSRRYRDQEVRSLDKSLDKRFLATDTCTRFLNCLAIHGKSCVWWSAGVSRILTKEQKGKSVPISAIRGKNDECPNSCVKIRTGNLQRKDFLKTCGLGFDKLNPADTGWKVTRPPGMI